MVLIKIGNRWALVSRTNSNKVLKWFGGTKPTADAVEAEERRIQFFKALNNGKIPGEKIKKKKYASVKKHMRKNGKIVKAHLRKIPKRKKKGEKYPNYR